MQMSSHAHDSRVGDFVRSLGRATARFGRDKGGANTVEFGLVALPFFALLMAIIEAAMTFFAAQVLETGLRDAARLIRTGQAHGTAGFNAAAFKTEVCNRIPALINCPGITIDVRETPAFGTADFNVPRSGGNFNPGAAQFAMGQAGTIVVARAFYEWPSFANLLGSSLSNQPNGKILLVSTSAFRNEPFGLPR